jgi:hypothetical protein
LHESDRGCHREPDGDADPPRPARVVGPQQQRHDHAADGADEGDGEVDLADQQDEDDADRDRRDRRHLQEQVREVPLGEEDVLEQPEGDEDHDEADHDRQRAELARPHALEPEADVATEGVGRELLSPG